MSNQFWSNVLGVKIKIQAFLKFLDSFLKRTVDAISTYACIIYNIIKSKAKYNLY